MAIISGPNWQIPNINTVLFDKDGTFIDSHIYWGQIIQRRARAIISFFKIDEDKYTDICKIMGFDLELETLLPQGPIALLPRDEVIVIVNNYLISLKIQSTRAVLNEIFIKVHDIFLKDIDQYICLIPGCVDLFIQLKKYHLKLAVVTTDTQSNTIKTLEKLHLLKFFDIVIGKESTKEPKRTGIPALKAIKEMGSNPAHTVCIGDAPMDMQMGKMARCQASIGVTTGQLGIETLSVHTSYVVESLSNLNVREDN